METVVNSPTLSVLCNFMERLGDFSSLNLMCKNVFVNSFYQTVSDITSKNKIHAFMRILVSSLLPATKMTYRSLLRDQFHERRENYLR